VIGLKPRVLFDSQTHRAKQFAAKSASISFSESNLRDSARCNLIRNAKSKLRFWNVPLRCAVGYRRGSPRFKLRFQWYRYSSRDSCLDISNFSIKIYSTIRNAWSCLQLGYKRTDFGFRDGDFVSESFVMSLICLRTICIILWRAFIVIRLLPVACSSLIVT